MNSYTEQEFNSRMARLEGLKQSDSLNGYVKELGEGEFTVDPDYYNDLNHLMPLAFKYYLIENVFPGVSYEVWLETIRNNLWQIAQEKQNEI